MKIPLSLILPLVLATTASACLRDEIDDKTIQWSSLIVQARLVEVSERVEMKALAVKNVSAVYWHRVYSFEVEKVIDGNTKPKYRIEVIRFFGKVDDPNSTTQPAKPAPAITDPCLQHLRKTSIGQSFVLLLRQEQDIKMHKPPVWSDTKNLDPRDAEVHGLKAYAVIHLLTKAQATDAELAKLRKVLTETRTAEKKIPDTQIKKEVEAILHAKTDEEAQSPIAALKNVGYKAVGTVKSARDKKETPPAAKERLAKLAIDLSPPPLTIVMEAHTE